MSVTVTKVQKGSQGSVNWHIQDFTTDFDIIKNHAKCTLTITPKPGELASSSPVEIQFFLKENGEIQKNSDDYVKRIIGTTALSLFGELVSEELPTMLISVDVQTNKTNPSCIREKVCTIEKIKREFLVHENFINKEKTCKPKASRNSGFSDGLGDSNYGDWPPNDFPKHKELNIKITATILNINKNELTSVDVQEGAVGQARARAKTTVAEEFFVNHVKMMFNAEENYSDLKMETRDNMTLSGHRFILAARSPGFHKLIEEQSQKGGFMGTVKLDTVDAKPLIVVLHWMYTGELHENAGKVMEKVIEICTEFEIPVLLKILDTKLVTICNVDNMFQLFQLSKQHGLSRAKEAISKFIKENIGSS